MTESLPIIELLKMTKKYGQRVAIDVADFSIFAQDRILFLGENGSGKSTLFRLLVGASSPSTGSVVWSNNANDIRLGYMPQAGGIYDDLTLRQNLNVYCKLYGRTNDDLVFEDPIIKRSALASLLDARASDLSGGTKQLATLACILAAQPNALVLDEPLSQLDVSHERLAYEILSDVAPNLRFLLVSSHNDPGQSLFDRKVVMKDGRILS